MYGLLLINMQDYVTKVFGAKQYEEVREALKIKDVSITSIHNAVNGFFCNFCNVITIRNPSVPTTNFPRDS